MTPASGAGPYLDMPIGRFLDLLAAGEPAPGAGAAAALAVAFGASLCAMAARLSSSQLGPDHPRPNHPRPDHLRPDRRESEQARSATVTPAQLGPAELVAEAERLRDRAASLADADAAAYGRVIAALRLPGEQDAKSRRWKIASTLSAAADVPMQVVEIGARVAGLGARLATDGNPNLRGDAATAALLAEAGARAAAVLVRINLADAAGDDRPARAERLVHEAARSAARAQKPPT